MKYVFPAVWIGMFGVGTCAFWLGALRNAGNMPPADEVKWFFTAFFIGMAAFLLWFCGRLKRVQVDDDAIYVSNYWSEVRIPLTEISRFTQSYMSNPPTITIHLRGTSPAGSRVVFIRPFAWVMFGRHPLIAELQDLCDRANARGGVTAAKAAFDPADGSALRILQAVCAFFCLLSLLSAITGIEFIEMTDHLVIVRHVGLGRVYALSAAFACAAAFYGIYKRSPIAWTLGWLVPASWTITLIGTALPGVLREPPPFRWVAAGMTAVGGNAVIIVWSLWWWKQRTCFLPVPSRTYEARVAVAILPAFLLLPIGPLRILRGREKSALLRPSRRLR